ncbi:hypothetical protein FQ186_01345 [Pseudomonas sp. ANT_H14]|nr:hypothetical protein FQ182_03930 [Pseudomonas sp. ANT_H4]KAA0954576.1 hypothetical protein FQ186_01345 [Pseudomonas sp. ANT_H14]
MNRYELELLRSVVSLLFLSRSRLIAISVGASLLAVDVNDDAGHQNKRGALEFIAGKPGSYRGSVNVEI